MDVKTVIMERELNEAGLWSSECLCLFWKAEWSLLITVLQINGGGVGYRRWWGLNWRGDGFKPAPLSGKGTPTRNIK